MAQPLQTSSDIDDVIQRLNRAVDLQEPHAICSGVRDTLMDLARNHAAAIPHEFFQESPDSYARRLLYRCPNGVFSAMVMVWGAEQGTPVHDHAGKWCVECVLRGQIEITAYEPHGDPSNDEVVRLTRARTTVANVGEVGILVPPNEYHTIRNAGSDVAVTIHVYAGEMLWCHAFHPRGAGGYRRERLNLSYT